MSKYLNKLIKSSGNQDARIVTEGLPGSDIRGYIDTGCYALNAIFSGSIFGGLPNNKIAVLAGETATGKTFFVLCIIKQFLQDNPEGTVVYFDSEQAVTSDMFRSRGIDTERVAVLPVGTVEDFRTQAFRIIETVLQEPESDRKPMIIVLDSLGMLSTEKQLSDVAEGKNVRDMTKAQLVKGAFTALTLKAGKAAIPVIVTSHVYSIINSYVPTKELSGGEGTKYASSSMFFLSKKKDKDEKKTVGSIIRVVAMKHRFIKEQTEVHTNINFETGLSKYYGLLEIAMEAGVFVKDGNKIAVAPDKKVFESKILESPEEYFTNDVLKKIDEYVQTNFKYGSVQAEEPDESEV